MDGLLNIQERVFKGPGGLDRDDQESVRKTENNKIKYGKLE